MIKLQLSWNLLGGIIKGLSNCPIVIFLHCKYSNISFACQSFNWTVLTILRGIKGLLWLWIDLSVGHVFLIEILTIKQY